MLQLQLGKLQLSQLISTSAYPLRWWRGALSAGSSSCLQINLSINSYVKHFAFQAD